jgi:hypothetical protein
VPRRLAIVVVLLLAGCGAGKGSSYVGTTGDAAVHVTWTRSDRSLTGQYTRALAPGGAGRTDQVGFTGTVYGSSVKLKLARGVGTLTTLDGTLSGDTLTLDYPGTDGNVSTIRLSSGDGKAFDRDLASLRGRAAGAKRAAAAAPVGTATPAAASAGGPAQLRSALVTIKASYATVVSDRAYNYTDTICDDAGTVDEQVNAMQAAAPPHPPAPARRLLDQAKALKAKADAACREIGQ